MKHNSEGEVNVITIFGNCNVASWGAQRIQTATLHFLAHGKTSSQNSQKGSEQLGIFSTKFAESTQTAQVMPNNCKSSTSSTTTTTTTASKKTPRPGNNTVYFIQILTTTAITKSKTKSKVAEETPQGTQEDIGRSKVGGFCPHRSSLGLGRRPNEPSSN